MSKNASSSSRRPLSPHIGIYRKQISSVMSILHRISGVALFLGTALMVVWLWTAAYAPNYYGTLHECMTSVLGQLCLLGWTAAFYYHLGNGIRHLFWDMGKGFAIPVMHKTGWAVLLFACAMTALTWGAALSTGGQ
jgi:succinate dehydrogenase / fumarate reductase, cytochrome b subunit